MVDAELSVSAVDDASSLGMIDGRYVGTITGDRLVFRSTDSASVGSPFSAANRAGSARANRAGSAVSGDEPDIPD